MSIDPGFDAVSGPFPQWVERVDPASGLRRIRTYYDPQSFFEARELRRGAWTTSSWGRIPRDVSAAYVRHILPPFGVLHSRPYCGDRLHRLIGLSERGLLRMLAANIRWCRRCAIAEEAG